MKASIDHHHTATLTQPQATWRRHAACHGLAHTMDPPTPTPDTSRRALAICRACPALNPCATWVLGLDQARDPSGVCGGMTEETRSRARYRTRTPRKGVRRWEA